MADDLPMDNVKIFVIEDDDWYGQLIEYHLSLNPDYEVQLFNNAKEALKNLHQKPAVITLDYSLPDMNGAEVLEKIKRSAPDSEVVILSGQEDVKVAVKLLQQGAYDYIVKDDDAKDRLWNTVNKILENRQLKGKIEELQSEVEQKYDFSKNIIGNSPAMQKVFKLMEKAVKTNITVSISGETGTGKELVAKSIHYGSLRKKEAFVAINLSAIPKDLIESELFGYEKGAFTGANTRRKGKFELAHKGTLFLDEIAEVDMNIQTKLLRVLQERELNRIGGSETIKFDIRLLVATHKDLKDEVAAGRFREDLYYRVIGLPITLPPLRERENDVLHLAQFFLNAFCKQNELPKLTISSDARKKLLSYKFPGNVRELKAVMDLAAVMAQDGVVEAEDITFNEVSGAGKSFIDEKMTMKEYTERIIFSYLDKYDNDVLRVADMLDIGKSTIYRMIKKKKNFSI